jgi:hopanoid biosynthesis associated RND transporter like protein HpnN
MLPRLLGLVVERCRRHAVLVLLIGLVLAGASLWAASQRLGVSTDTDALFARSLPWRQRQLAWDRDFPQFKNLIVAVIDADEPEMADATAAGLAAALRADPAHFRTVTRPDASPYFERNGLLFLDQKTLSGLLDQTIDAQPFLGQLVADPSARGLFAALNLVAMGVARGEADLASFEPALEAFHHCLDAALDGHPVPLSWETLLAGPLMSLAGKYHFVLVQPRLDYAALEPGGAATAALRAAAAKLEFVAEGRARVRITGQIPLADEEFATVAQGALAGTLISVALIALWLLLAVRGWRLIVPILLTLVLGLLLTTGFAAMAVGTLNLVSVAFAILFVGIAVDFAIQFSVRYRDSRRRLPDPAAALRDTAHGVGPQILVAGTAVAAGFLAFVPTDFSGVAELGLIAGVGMLVAFACTITFLPAAITLLRPRGEAAEIGFRTLDALERRGIAPARRVVLGAFLLAGVLGAVLVPRITFDSDPLHTKNPNTEAMRTLADLMDNPMTNPYSADIIAPDQAAADALAARMRDLPLAADVLTLSSFVPTDQAAKLPMIADAANLLAASLQPRSPPAPITAAAVRDAARATASALDSAITKLGPDSPLRAIDADLHRLGDPETPDATALAANQALVRFLPNTLSRLRAALAARPVTIADVPASIARDWRLPDGRARVQVLAKPSARNAEGLEAFAAQVRTLAPDAVGSAVTIAGTAATIVGAFRSAALLAVVAIAAILALVLRRVMDVGLVLLPLGLSAMMTVLVIVLLPLPLNFANIIALPLLLGVGVSFNVYFVMNWRAGARAFLGTATARAVIFSALTTSTAFGSLALSAHPGTASMGDLLLVSLGCTLLVSLVFMPALLLSLRPPAPPG